MRSLAPVLPPIVVLATCCGDTVEAVQHGRSRTGLSSVPPRGFAFLLALAGPLTLLAVACGGSTLSESLDGDAGEGTSSGFLSSSSDSRGQSSTTTSGPSSSSPSASTSTTSSTRGSTSNSDGLPDGACRTAADCPDGNDEANCVGPISLASVCMVIASCMADSQCEQGLVCSTGAGAQPNDSPFGSTTPACRPPCTSNAACNFWESCGAGGHCRPLPCSSCPSYLTCSSNACGPTGCKTDSDCPGGFCVDATCYGTLGSCEAECG